MRPTHLILSIAVFSVACEGEVLTPATGFVSTECPLEDPNCDKSGFRIDSGLGTAPDSGAPLAEADSGDPNGGALDSGLHADAADPSVDSGASPDAGVAGFPDANSPPPEYLILQGTHDVQYVFDLSDYLLGLNGIAGPLDFINRAIQGRLVSDPILGALVNPIIRNLANQYIPSWAQQIIDILSNVASFFERMEVMGVMNIAQPNAMSPGTLTANETWQRLYLQFISQCPFGYMDRNYPTCAMRQVNIVPMTPSPVGPLDVEVEVHDFTGLLQPGRPSAAFTLGPRNVDMDLRKLLIVALDMAVRLATNGRIPDVRTALDQLIDCQGLANGVNNFLGGNLAAYAIVLSTCNNEKSDAIDAIIDGLAGVAGSASFDFTQTGFAVDTNGNHRANRLAEIATRNTIVGDFRVLIGADLAGEWAGQARNP